VALDLRLAHKTGRAVAARTLDLSAGGARVTSERPLRVDEEMRFDVDLAVDGRHIEGVARVLRQDRHNVYALRFERVNDATLADLRSFVDASVVSRASA
jgi:c-di-GMP-binding flagellar brake protein YcgR